MSNKKGGLLFGVIMGTVLGVLFAPRKGKDLRKQLQDEVEKGGTGAETLKKSFSEMSHDIASTADDIYHKPEVQKHVAKGKKKLNQFLKTAGKQMDKAQSQVEELGHKAQEKFQEAREQFGEGIDKMKNKIMGEATEENDANTAEGSSNHGKQGHSKPHHPKHPKPPKKHDEE